MGTILTKMTRLDASTDLMLVDDSGSPPLPSYDVQDFVRTSSDGIASLEVRYQLLPDGSRRTSRGHREKQCLTCLRWIDLGDTASGDAALVNHEGKRRCLATVHANMLEAERRAEATALDGLRQTASWSPHTPYQPQRSYLPYPPLSPLSFVSGSLLST